VKDFFGREIPDNFRIGFRRDQLAESLWEHGEDELAERALTFSESELYEAQLLAVWNYKNLPEPTTGPRLQLGRINALAAIELVELASRDTKRRRRRTRPQAERHDAEYHRRLLAHEPTDATPVEQNIPGTEPPLRLPRPKR
jgi:hypothetical protein